MAALLGAGLLFAPTPAEARPRPVKRASKFQANKTFGLGGMLGAPTGLSGKWFVGDSTAIDFGLGTIYGYRDRHGMHTHADFLWHPVSLASASGFELPLYLGVGGRLFNGRRCYRYDRGVCELTYRDYTALGVRGPIGLAFDFNNIPLDIFVEAALVMDILFDYDDNREDRLYFDVNGAVGVRYYFL
jgi:hypothetical protein